jgi:tripartite-type tricarboxylate transporter receptor subunit TctC
VATFDEAGYKGFEMDAWMGLLAPAGTPKPRIEALSREIARIVRLPEIQQKLKDQAFDAVGSTPGEMDLVLREDSEKWARLITQLGIKPE